MNKNFLGGFVVGTALGFLVGLLSAPEEGIVFKNRLFNIFEEEIDKITISTRRIAELFRRKEIQNLPLEEELH